MQPRSSSSFSVKTGRAPLVLVALSLLLFAGQSAGQGLKTLLVGGNLVPIDSSNLYPSSAFSLTGGGVAQFGDGSNLDMDGDNFIDPSFNDLDGTGSGTLGVVDWVIVELRFVANGAGVPINGSQAGQVQEARSVSKTGLLLTDGSIVDASDPSGGLLSFEGVTFDDSSEDMYVVVDHRNHLAVISANPLVDEGNDGDWNYDFTEAPASAFGGAGSLKAVTSLSGAFLGTRYALYAGDADGNNEMNNADADLIQSQIIEGSGRYRAGDIDLSTGAGNADLDLLDVNAVIGQGAFTR